MSKLKEYFISGILGVIICNLYLLTVIATQYYNYNCIIQNITSRAISLTVFGFIVGIIVIISVNYLSKINYSLSVKRPVKSSVILITFILIIFLSFYSIYFTYSIFTPPSVCT